MHCVVSTKTNSNFQNVVCSWLGFHFGARKNKVATKTISYKRYGEILFLKVALCYLLHVVQDGSSKNTLENRLLHINLRIPKVTRPDVHLGVTKTHKIVTTIMWYRRYKEILFQKVASGYVTPAWGYNTRFVVSGYKICFSAGRLIKIKKCVQHACKKQSKHVWDEFLNTFCCFGEMLRSM